MVTLLSRSRGPLGLKKTNCGTVVLVKTTEFPPRDIQFGWFLRHHFRGQPLPVPVAASITPPCPQRSYPESGHVTW